MGSESRVGTGTGIEEEEGAQGQGAKAGRRERGEQGPRRTSRERGGKENQQGTRTTENQQGTRRESKPQSWSHRLCFGAARDAVLPSLQSTRKPGIAQKAAPFRNPRGKKTGVGSHFLEGSL